MSCISTSNLAYGRIAYHDLEIEEGCATFVSGPSGCGKSTLLRLFNKTISPTQGCVLLRGEDMAGLDSVALRRQVLLAGQSVFLFDGSVGENFALFSEARDAEPPSAQDQTTFLRLCCANFPLDAPCQHLSGGAAGRPHHPAGRGAAPDGARPQARRPLSQINRWRRCSQRRQLCNLQK